MARESREELEREGWERRGAFAEPRLSELVELYESLGFEVRLLPAEPADFRSDPACAPCLADLSSYKTICTRRLK